MKTNIKRKEQDRETLNETPEDLRVVSAQEILRIANSADREEKIIVAGKEWNAKRVQDHLPAAIKEIKRVFKDRFKVDLGEIFFEQLEGNTVGEAREGGTFIDPAMFGHPIGRMAHVLAHELAHAKKEIMSETLVEGLVGIFMPDGIKHDYNNEVELFKKIAKHADPNKDIKAGAEKLYDLYAKGRFEDMYQAFYTNHIQKLPTDEQQERAFNLFSEAFPELTYMGERIGEFTLKDYIQTEATGTVHKSKKKPTERENDILEAA